ncbi:MAG: Gfo/Idh/MocA family oxidoreductase [Acutalibacteraceae bacterium]|nr:Gfo/Idh/MocA family oxidoreductase [Acutalibacteraceae bacterium]
MIRLATVGTSDITEKFISAVKLTNRFHLKTAYSRSEEKGKMFCEKHGFDDFCTDINELAKSPDIDAVYIASPNSLHYSQSKLFLENGKHVFCEKPVTMTVKEYDGLSALAEKTGVIYAEAIMSRHYKGRKVLFDALSEIGDISIARIDYCQRSSRYDSFKNGEHMNIFDMSLGAGTLTDLGVYCVYAAVDMFGMPQSVKASASYFENGADKSGSAIFEYQNFTAVLSYSKAGQSAICSEIVGDKGVLKIGSVSQYADISLVKDGKETKLSHFPSRDEIMGDEAIKFADYIENFKEFKNDYSEVSHLTHNVHTCMDLIKQSAEIKYPIKECIL